MFFSFTATNRTGRLPGSIPSPGGSGGGPAWISRPAEPAWRRHKRRGLQGRAQQGLGTSRRISPSRRQNLGGCLQQLQQRPWSPLLRSCQSTYCWLAMCQCLLAAEFQLPFIINRATRRKRKMCFFQRTITLYMIDLKKNRYRFWHPSKYIIQLHYLVHEQYLY